jgi:hypothetical protein
VIPGFPDTPDQPVTQELGPPTPAHAPLPTAPDPNTSSTEPLLTRTAVVTGASALIELAVAFGWDLTARQDVALLAIVNLVVAPIVLWVWSRRSVYSPATVARLLAARGKTVVRP